MARLHLCVVSIKFGIKHSACCLSFDCDYQESPTKYRILKWKMFRPKSSSCILFTPDKTFHSFGYEAEDKYEELTADNEHNKWYFFEHPTKMLYDCKDVDRSSTIFDETNKPFLAIKVYASAIKYLKDVVMRRPNHQLPYRLHIEDIQWVSLFLIHGMVQPNNYLESQSYNGIPDEQLALCLETEAVSTLYRYLTNEDMSDPSKDDSKKSILQTGSKYLILNAGEEFTYVTVLEVLYSGKLRELHKTSGCAWGNSTVNQAFIEFMKFMSLVGAEVLKEFKEKNRDEYVSRYMGMVSRFDIIKNPRKLKMHETFNQYLPFDLMQIYKEREHKMLDTVIKESRYSGKVYICKGNMLIINPEIVKSFFSNTCDSIIRHINRVLYETNAKDISTILMVGDLSESLLFQEAVKQAFPDKRVCVSNIPEFDVLRGSIIFGHDSNSIITTNVTKNTCRGPRKF